MPKLKYNEHVTIYMTPAMCRKLKLLTVENNTSISRYIRDLIANDKTYQKTEKGD